MLAPCIHWTDRRDPEETRQLYDGLGRSRLIDRSGTLPIPGLVLANLTWTRRHLPEVWRRVRFALPPKDYLAYRLTGDIGTDPTGPTRSLLNDWRHQDWSLATCAEAGIPREILPDVKYQAWKPRGTLGPAAHDLGLAPGTTLVAGGGDDPAAALGSGVVNPGDVSIGTGSSMSWRVVGLAPRFDPTGLIGLMPHVVPGRYLHEMVVTGTGTTLRWFRGAFGHGMSYEQLIAEGARIGRGSEGLLCFPYLEGATVPRQDDAARAVYYGIAGHHQRAHFIRSTLEGAAYQYPALLEVVRSRGHQVGPLTISDGEARNQLWNQIKADVTGQTITPAVRAEAPSIGAAILAGLGAGLFGSVGRHSPWRQNWRRRSGPIPRPPPSTRRCVPTGSRSATRCSPRWERTDARPDRDLGPAGVARLLAPFAAATEQAGFDELWVPEDCFLSGGIAQAAVALATTSRIGVGIGIMPAGPAT